MSFTIFRNFRHLNLIQTSSRDLSIVNRLCIHCTIQHRQKDDGVEPANMIGPSQTLKSISKEDMISKAMKTYLERKQKADKIMDLHKSEYDLGRRHLANIMGLEEEELTPDKIRGVIAYLLPSGLHNKKARPLMQHPTLYIPHSKGQEFDLQGRPTHFMYYTLKPRYFELMHDMAWKVENLKKLSYEANITREDDERRSDFDMKWISYEDFGSLFPGEKTNEHDYNRFLVLIQRLLDHPMSHTHQQFIDKFRVRLIAKSLIVNIQKTQLDEHDREFVISNGRRKTSKATVRLTSKGHGEININGQDITYFRNIVQRKTILAPLLLCQVIDKFDVEAHVTEVGPTADAGAIRLGVARGLLSFVPEDMRERLRIAGYLTPDPRMRERKKPGQEGARKKFVWKRR